eukprot:Tamp_08279.p4 GENE.Tamp_08279~~Tamp_08279.p4  ORF type:complete len:132 (-),score=19.89 Tamp_08279:1426-1821(-)
MIQHSYENAEGARVPFPQFESPMHFFGMQDVTFESNVDGGFVEEHKSKEMLLPRQDFDTQHQVHEWKRKSQQAASTLAHLKDTHAEINAIKKLLGQQRAQLQRKETMHQADHLHKVSSPPSFAYASSLSEA